MLIIAKEAEINLKTEIKNTYAHDKTMRCFHIRFSESSSTTHGLYEAFFRHLENLPSAYKAQVYICHDLDVFILMHDFMLRQFVQFLEDLSFDLKNPALANAYAVFELGIHWQTIIRMCDIKLAKIADEKTKQQSEQKHEKTDAIVIDILAHLDPTLIKTISERRKKQRSPVIMVVDDDQLTRTLVRNVIQEEYNCIIAGTGKEALEQYVRHTPHLVFLDIGLPDIDGYDVLEHIFLIDPHAHVIMFSGHKDKAHMLRAMRTGAEGFVGKPFTRKNLFHYIHNTYSDETNHRNPPL